MCKIFLVLRTPLIGLQMSYNPTTLFKKRALGVKTIAWPEFIRMHNSEANCYCYDLATCSTPLSQLLCPPVEKYGFSWNAFDYQGFIERHNWTFSGLKFVFAKVWEILNKSSGSWFKKIESSWVKDWGEMTPAGLGYKEASRKVRVRDAKLIW